MRLEVEYKLYRLAGERYVLENHNSYSIIDVEEVEDEDQMDKIIEKELSKKIGRPPTNFKILTYTKL